MVELHVCSNGTITIDLDVEDFNFSIVLIPNYIRSIFMTFVSTLAVYSQVLHEKSEFWSRVI